MQFLLSFGVQNLVVGCAEGIARADCPLLEPEGGNYISIALTSANFCTDTGATNKITGLIDTNFLAPDKRYLKRDTNGNVQQAVWMFSRVIYMRLDFSSKLNISVQTTSPIFFETRYYDSTASAGNFNPIYGQLNGVTKAAFPPGMISGPINTAVAGSLSMPTGGQFGLDTTDQSYLMQHIVNSYFTQGDSPPDNTRYNLEVRFTFQVGYTQAASSRRRSRQFSASAARRQSTTVLQGQGSAALPIQSVTAYSDAVATTSTPESTTSSSSVSVGLIAGIAAGVAAAIVLAIGAVFIVVRRRKESDKKKQRKANIANSDTCSEDDESNNHVRVGASAGAVGLMDKKGLGGKGRKQTLQPSSSRLTTATSSGAMPPGQGKKQDLARKASRQHAAERMALEVEGVIVETSMVPVRKDSKGKGKKVLDV